MNEGPGVEGGGGGLGGGASGSAEAILNQLNITTLILSFSSSSSHSPQIGCACSSLRQLAITARMTIRASS